MVYFVDTLVCESAESWFLEASFVWNLLIWRLWMHPKKCDSGFQFCPMSLNIGWDQWLIQLHCLQTSNTKTDSDYRSKSKVSAPWWRLASATHLGRRHDRYSGSWAAWAPKAERGLATSGHWGMQLGGNSLQWTNTGWWDGYMMVIWWLFDDIQL